MANDSAENIMFQIGLLFIANKSLFRVESPLNINSKS